MACRFPGLKCGSALLALLAATGTACARAEPPPPAAPLPASIRVLVNDALPPLSFRDDSGRLLGARIELWQLWQQKTGVRVEFLTQDWKQAADTMEAGGADVIDLLERSPAREQRYDFSGPHVDIDAMLFFNRRITGIVDAASARGFMVGVGVGDACAEHLRARGVTRLMQFDSAQKLIAAVQAGELQLFCMQEPPASYLLQRAGLADTFRHTPPLYTRTGHWAVRKGTNGLLRVVAQGFARITPGERQQIDDKWFGAAVAGQTLPVYLRNAGFIVLALATLAAVLVGWGQMLRRQVAARTRDLSLALAERQQAQQELDRHREHLEERIGQRVEGCLA